MKNIPKGKRGVNSAVPVQKPPKITTPKKTRPK